jgi:hypothetical protein
MDDSRFYYTVGIVDHFCHIDMSEWVESTRGILKSLFKHVRSNIRTNNTSAFNKPEVIQKLNRLYEEYVLVLADKACNNTVFVCKAHFINELSINSAIGNRTYTPTTFSKDDFFSKPCIRFKYS